MDEIDDCRLTEEDFKQWKEVLGNLEELGDQDSIDEALEKMRNGTWLHVYRYRNEELHIIRKVDMPEGESEEHVFIFVLGKEDTMRLSSVSSIAWWSEDTIQYIGSKHLTLTKEEALEQLKAGVPILTPGYVYFTGKIHNDRMPELADKDFVFTVHRDEKFPESVYLAGPIETFNRFDTCDRYGIWYG